jgi:hypothetical protein
VGTLTAALGIGALAIGFGARRPGVGRLVDAVGRTLAIVGGLLLVHPAPWADLAGAMVAAAGVGLARVGRR